MIQRCLRCGGGARNPVCAKCRRIVGDVHSPVELQLVERENAFIEEAVTTRHSAAGIASFFVPGLGQIMKGQPLTAIGVWIGFAISLLLIFMGGLALMFIVWCAQLDDAFRAPDYWTKKKLREIAARRGWRR